MFEAAELGQRLKKKAFKERERSLHTQLLEVQRRLRGSEHNVLVIISGVEGAGKGEVVNRLNAWLDARALRTEAYWSESDEERERPALWRFWRHMPPRGEIGIMFGSWYTRPIVEHTFKRMDEAFFDRQMARIAELERMLWLDGTILVKLWFHLSRKDQRKQLGRDARSKGKAASPYVRKFSTRYKRFRKVSERALRATDFAGAPWVIVESHDARFRDMTAGEALLATLGQRLGQHLGQRLDEPREEVQRERVPAAVTALGESRASVLDQVDLAATLSPESYDRRLSRHQRALRDMAWRLHAAGRNVVAVFEGWDAAGKGGAIRRVTAGIDARLLRVISVAAPTDEERARHYLWRFWRHVPRAGHLTIYDRSWYGRVLVERVEGFASPQQWQRAYQEINSFEEQLAEHGTAVLKFWLHLSPEEQLARFEERQRTPWKLHKITDEDWRNRERWADYTAAVHEMVARTSTAHAPWTLVAGNDKRHARIEVLSTFTQRLQRLVR